ncbi:MAG: hypothetical protein DI563_02625 [Variovorax paradoxus]|uniref:Beta protein n=1 Tax=Variovorax paradoxus TaxID=34073 RepID=A0A2W5QS63_VARPD|nr:MAG: hypothetical protein DI563_02625 [Variovorax paradoxus]
MNDWKYLPILKWKQGERIAVRQLEPAHWTGVVPLVELLAIDSAPDAASLRAALPAYLAKVAKEIKAAVPEDRALAVDVRFVSPAYARQLQLLEAVCRRLQAESDRRIYPVLGNAAAAREAADLPRLASKFDEFIVRIDVPSSTPAEIKPVFKLVNDVLKPSPVHVAIDQQSMVGHEPKAAALRIKPYLDEALAAGGASVTLAGGSFPMNLIGFKQGVVDIERVEWKVWRQIVRTAAYTSVKFSDYAVTNPAPVPDMDPTQMNPSVAIRYAADGFWRLFKAGGFKKGAPNQYQALCKLLLGDVVYSGSGFSYGDRCYSQAANAKLGNGNPSSWRRDATSHHLVLTAAALP